MAATDPAHFDNLDYVDAISPAERDAVNASILAELLAAGSALPPHPALPPTLLSTPLTSGPDYDRVAAGLPSTAQTRQLHAFPALPPPGAPLPDVLSALEAGRLAVEAQTTRALNADLLHRYGVDAWKTSVPHGVGLAARAKERVAQLDAAVEGVHASRREAQSGPGVAINAAAAKRRFDDDARTALELAVGDAEREVKKLRAAAVAAGLVAAEE